MKVLLLVKSKSVYKNAAGQWHHSMCPLIYNNEQCLLRKKIKKLILQNILRLRKRSSINRINFKNGDSTTHIKVLKKRIKLEKNCAYQSSKKISILKKSLINAQEKKHRQICTR